MKKLFLIVALVAIYAIATQAQGVIVTSYPAPKAYNLDITPSFPLDQMPKIVLTGSEKNVSYQLVLILRNSNKDTCRIGEPVKGTGSPMIFDTHNTSYHNFLYAIEATKEGCAPVMMKDTLIIGACITAAKYDPKKIWINDYVLPIKEAEPNWTLSEFDFYLAMIVILFNFFVINLRIKSK